LWRPFRRLVAVLLAAAAMVAFTTQSASALTVTIINSDGQGVSSRSAPQNGATNGYGAPANASVSTVCWTTGDPVGPNSNRLWWLISYAGRQFYVADRYLSTPYVAGSTPSEPRCGASDQGGGGPAVKQPPASTYVSSDAPVVACPDQGNLGCRQVSWTIPKNSAVSMICWMDAPQASTGAYSSKRWFVVRYGDKEAWVHSSWVQKQTSVGWCGNDISKKAEIWAAQRYGETKADSATIALFTDWTPGPPGEWSGDCVKLGSAAWHWSGRDPLRGDAYAQYQAYLRAGKVRATGTPPMGALVWYKIAMPWGHVNVSIGGGYAVTTNGVDKNGYANSIKAISSYSNYLGWAMP
jgi:hypothetical protein